MNMEDLLRELNYIVSKMFFLPKGGKGYVWAEKIMLLHIALKYNALKENIITKSWLISFVADVFGFWILDPFS